MGDMEQHEMHLLRLDAEADRFQGIQEAHEEYALKFGIKLIIAGGRDFNDYDMVRDAMKLFDLVQIGRLTIVSGGARGADLLGERWAKINSVEIKRYIPAWRVNGVYDNAAGYKRNALMADNATHLLAFWDGVSKGTGHMIDLARSKNLGVEVIEYEWTPAPPFKYTRSNAR